MAQPPAGFLMEGAGQIRRMVTFVLLHVRARDHVVLTGPAIRRPMKFKTREQAKDWARKHFPGSVVREVLRRLPLMRASMALGRQMLITSSGTAGHLSGSDRAARRPTGKVARCWRE